MQHPHVHPEYECAFEKDAAPRYAYMSISNSVGLATAPQGWVSKGLGVFIDWLLASVSNASILKILLRD